MQNRSETLASRKGSYQVPNPQTDEPFFAPLREICIETTTNNPGKPEFPAKRKDAKVFHNI